MVCGPDLIRHRHRSSTAGAAIVAIVHVHFSLLVVAAGLVPGGSSQRGPDHDLVLSSPSSRRLLSQTVQNNTWSPDEGESRAPEAPVGFLWHRDYAEKCKCSRKVKQLLRHKQTRGSEGIVVEIECANVTKSIAKKCIERRIGGQTVPTDSLVIRNSSAAGIRAALSLFDAEEVTLRGNSLEGGNLVLCGTKNTPDCSRFRKLRRLDLRGNSLRTMAEAKLDGLEGLWLADNIWSCSEADVAGLLWLLSRQSQINDSSSTFCAKVKTNSWSNNLATEPVRARVGLLELLNFTQEMSSDCPEVCRCHVSFLYVPLLVVNVDCRNASLKALPSHLPRNTRILDVSHNQISSLAAVRTNPSYAQLNQLSASHNLIVTLEDLRGSPFLRYNIPTTLNLQFNKLTQLDTELLEPTLSVIEGLHYDGTLNYLFAGNPWDCGCDNLRKVQNFIYKFQVLLRDSDYLSCDKDQFLISADYEALCTDRFDYLSLLVGLEIFLLVVVLAKLVHDVVHYRQTGELPWLARHICLGYSYSGLRKPGENRSLCIGGDQHGCASDAPDASEASDAPVAHAGCLCTLLCCLSGQSRQRNIEGSDTSPGSTGRPSTGALQLLDAFRPRRHTDASSVHSQLQPRRASASASASGKTSQTSPGKFVPTEFSNTSCHHHDQRKKKKVKEQVPLQEEILPLNHELNEIV